MAEIQANRTACPKEQDLIAVGLGTHWSSLRVASLPCKLLTEEILLRDSLCAGKIGSLKPTALRQDKGPQAGLRGIGEVSFLICKPRATSPSTWGA